MKDFLIILLHFGYKTGNAKAIYYLNFDLYQEMTFYQQLFYPFIFML